MAGQLYRVKTDALPRLVMGTTLRLPLFSATLLPAALLFLAGRAAGQVLITSGTCLSNGMQYIQSLSECSSAAVALGLGDTTAVDDGQTSVSYDPPYCYIEWAALKFNGGGNSGSCTSTDRCLCSPPPPLSPP